MEKTDLTDLSSASEIRLLALTDNIVKDILTPILSRGRLPLARSELIGILGIPSAEPDIPTMVDGVRVLPETITQESSEKYSAVSEFIMRQEMEKYGLRGLKEGDSAARVMIMGAFVERIFGSAGKALLNNKINELGVRDVLNAPFYNKILLMEYILQDLLFFYVKPVKGLLYRSELITILGIDLEMVQGPVPYIEQADAEIIRHTAAAVGRSRSRLDFEDLYVFLLKKNLSVKGVEKSADMSPQEVNVVLSEVLSALLGDMTRHVFSRIQTNDEGIKSKFMIIYLRNYLARMMSKDDARQVCVRVTDSLGLTSSVGVL